MAAANVIDSERLAFDLFRHLTSTFRVKPQAIRQSSLKENPYSSDSYIKDIARPIIFYEILVRDELKQRLEKFPAENMSDTRDRLAILSNTLFNVYSQKLKLDIYKQVLMSVVTCMELVQYLHVLGRREFLNDMPAIWADIFDSLLREEFELAGGFDEYISYWNFLKATDTVTLKYMKRCSKYQDCVSEQYKTLIGQDFFKKPEVQRKVLCHKGDDLVGQVAVELMLGSIMQLEAMPHVLAPSADYGRSGEGSSSQSDASTSKRPKKLKPKPNQSFASFQAERRAEQGEKLDPKGIEDVIERMEALEILKL